MTTTEVPVVFDCEGDSLVGIVVKPSQPRSVGVVIIVGGPQCRTGSHRMFTMLARALGEQGYASMRFDSRGMGDSAGKSRDFTATGPDISTAVMALRRHVPTVQQIVLWGLCDGASAALLAVGTIPQLAGLVLANPWVRSETTHNDAILRHYYKNRLFSPQLWRDLISGRVRLLSSVRELLTRMVRSRRPGTLPDGTSTAFVSRMRVGWSARPPTLVLLSGRDITAREFEDQLAADAGWNMGRRPTRVAHLKSADHTFTRAADREEMSQRTLQHLSAMEKDCSYLSDGSFHLPAAMSMFRKPGAGKPNR